MILQYHIVIVIQYSDNIASLYKLLTLLQRWSFCCLVEPDLGSWAHKIMQFKVEWCISKMEFCDLIMQMSVSADFLRVG